MPVVGVASKLRQPAGGAPRPVHTALPMPNPGRTAQAAEPPALSCQLSIKPVCGYRGYRERSPPGQGKESEDSKVSKIYTDWANHYLAKSGCPRLIKDLTQDIADGVLLAEIIQIIANEKVEDINGCPRSHTQMIENVDACLSFLEARGLNVQGLSAEEIRNGNLKTILGLFFILSRYKQQQQQQQQYYQSLVELQQRVTHQSPGTAPAPHQKTQDMQSSLTARYASPSPHGGVAAGQKKNTRLPGPSRLPAAGSGGSKVPAASNLNRRSQSFNSMDKSKPLQYCSGNEREAAKGIPLPGSINGSAAPSPSPAPPSTQQPVSAIPSPSAGKSWRSKSMSVKHSATSSLLSVKAPSPATSPTPTPGSAPSPAPGSAPKSAGGGQRSMLEKFRLINTRGNCRPGPDLGLREEEEEALSECGEEVAPPAPPCGGSKQPSPAHGPAKGSGKAPGGKSLPQGKEDKAKGKSKASAASAGREERETPAEPAKKTSKIASLIPKGGKAAAVRKEGAPASSGIPKPGLKGASSGSGAGGKPGGPGAGPAGEKARPKGGQAQACYSPRALGRATMVSSTSTSALSGAAAAANATATATATATTPGNGAVQLPHQQLSHPNTATVAPFMYRTCSENDCTTVAPPDPGLSGPPKSEQPYGKTTELPYGKTAKQCLEEISGEDPETRRMRTVRNIADLRQNLEETMSSLRGTQITHSTLETTFDSTVTTEVNGRGIPALAARSSPMAWRLNQSASPRLQAGDAPSLPGRFVYTAPLRRGAGGAGQRGAELGERGGAEGGAEADVAGYMSDGDLLGKNARADDISSGYLTDGGLNLYSRNVGRAPDLAAASRDIIIQRGVKELQGELDSCDDSSSVSSGLSDTLDNISTDDLNTPSYSRTSASHRKNKESKTDAHKHSGHDSGSWGRSEKVEDGLDANMDPGHRKPSSSSSSSPAHYEDPDRTGRTTGLPVSQTGSWRRDMTAQVGITPPRTKGASGTIKTPGKTDDAKASEKGKAPPKAPPLQRSPSDAGAKSSGDEGKKPPSGLGRPAAGSFGFKKAGGPGSLMTASGSATLGKMPKGAATGGAGAGGRKTSLDGAQAQDDGARAPLQYRSLPRPAKSSSSAVTGRGGGAAGGSGKPLKRRDAGKVGSGRSSPVALNQTDKEKVGVAEPEACLSTSPKASPTSSGQSGLRQPGSKYPDIASPTFRRLFGSKASSKASSPSTPDSAKCPSALGSPHGTLARQVSLESPSSGTGSLGSGGGGQSGGSSPLYGRTPELGTGDASMASLASSPASCLSLPSAGSRAWPASLSGSSAGSKDTLSCQSMTSLHTSTESIDLPLSKVSRAGSVKSTLSEGMPLDRNTLPKKGLRYPPSSRQMSHEEGKEWLRSHSTGGLQDTGSQSLLSPSGTSCTVIGKYHFSNLLSPTSLSQYSLPAPSMSRSNSIPAQDSALDLYGEARLLGGSATSLEDRPRGISRSGSFRDSMEEVHGSSLSLVSSTSSLYSATEERAYSEGQTVQNPTQIRKLRRELDASQEKVATLTSQLSANSHLVAAFEKSLSNMTGRLQSLTMTAEQKESELAELRETIEGLKTQNTDAQTAIQVALNGPDHVHRDLRIRRQHSSDSMSSINSGTSHSSIGSAADADAKKKKKKSWLRSSFKQAFSKKKASKPASPHSDIEEQADSSLPSSPKLQHAASQGSVTSLRPSPSSIELCECTEAEAEIILQLKNELREKELKLTDIRLEALSSAHHLDQIREAMNRMQNEIELLKAENDQLKSTGSSTPPPPALAKNARPPSEASSTSSSSSRQSLGLSLSNLNITDTIMSADILLNDGYQGNLRKEGRSVRIVVSNADGSDKTKGTKCQQYLIGSIGVSGKTKWDVLDGVIRRLFKEYVFRVDPLTSLGLSSDSIVSYRIGDVVRGHASQAPELLPCGYLVGDNNVITISLKGVKESSIDSLAFDTLIPKPVVQRYLNLLTEHRRIILSGPSGTGKTFLAGKLAEHLIAKSGSYRREGAVASFNVDHKSSKDLRQYLSSLAEQCNSEETDAELPLVVILDNLHNIGALSDIFNGFLNCKYHKCPYVIGTMNQGVSSSPNLELHHNFRWVLCANHTEPVKGFLGRFLRRKLIETEIDRNMYSNVLIKIIDWIPKTWQHLNGFLEAHSSSDVTIGPRLFLSCPMDVDGSRVWFTDLWNYSLVPYLLEAVREGLQLYGKRAVWEDPSKWVTDSYPWSSGVAQRDWQALLRLRPEDVGYDGCSAAAEGAASAQTPPGHAEGDPLMDMLMRLQEAANYSSAQSCDSDSASNHDNLLDSSLESTL
ncbi:neuron navigator 3-like isoform X3 [Anguilla anguilla]|uniref:neuron navigator 3-like isoform X3 n=1 Tax=Anguilla anguilla TaxID=7936 RepID=UPI0015AD2409|nr:neuron navigator 3-like isoform X3 [Anguilla anguilla]